MLTGKKAIVTGAANGIGQCVALTMAGYGADIVVADMDLAGAEKTAEKIREMGREAIAVKVNVTNQVECADTVKKAVDTFGTLDILAHGAGINIACRMLDMTDAVWDKINNVNAKGTLYMDQAAARVMVENGKGKIVNMASISGKTPEESNGAYCASKAAVMSITQVLALELAEYQINVNAICPGPVNTKLMQDVFVERAPLAGETPEQFKARFLADIPLHRMAEPEDVAELMSFLSSDRASYITGQCYTISGGKIWT